MCLSLLFVFSFFFFNDPATTEIYTLSLHDALPIWPVLAAVVMASMVLSTWSEATATSILILGRRLRSEEHTSELQSHLNLVCRLLLEKKQRKKIHFMQETKQTEPQKTN